MTEIIIGCTGHRPQRLGGHSIAAWDRLHDIAEDYLREAAPSQVISGMAIGWDQAFACAAIKLGIPVVAAVPFVGQEALWPVQAKRDYRDTLSRCWRVHVVSDGGYSPRKFHKRNEWIVDHCTRVAAMWDGVKDGGTWNCVRYAQNLERPIDCLYERWSGKR